ncbi:hypothetical protein [Verrucosispora sp. WMMC514]|uniref:hypothetical protein n=1 Tax=Verrucosispora sp. WMMC514 TaxID=3015156 RepID=UPI00248B7EF6|nr:hypothetical protein [Verrucosispora sp. WMMC514]WBB92081.1 hypothetical protein O7597_03355 [Verrucosispora sp. WMMC514]
MTRDDEDIRGLLAGAVPPLAAPPERVAEVGVRVRRHRRRMAGGAAAAVALTVGLGVGLPALVAGPGRDDVIPLVTPGPRGDANCPTDLVGRPDLASVRYGDDEPLVPTGAVEITSCQVPVGGGLRPADRIGPRTLTTGVDEIVRLLNAQPPTQQDGRGRPRPDGDFACALMARYEETVLVLRYPDRDPVTVWTDANCGVAVTATHGRGADFGVLRAFLDRYRAQLATTTDPATVTTPACVDTFPIERMRKNSEDYPPDRIRLNNSATYPILPTRLIEVTACRYEVRGDTGELVGQQRRRAGADEVRAVLNQAFDRSAKGSDCGDWPDYQEPSVFDTLTVADATGETAEFWIRHEPCRSARHAYSSSRQLSAQLLAAVTDLLGQPPSR